MKSKGLTRVLVGSALLYVFQSASAQDLNYDYIEAGYVSTSVELGGSTDLDGNGFAVTGSSSISPNLAFGAGYSGVSYERLQGIDVDTSELTFGLLAHAALAPRTDVYASFSVLNADAEASNGFNSISEDDTGNTIGLGVRHLASDAVELGLGLSRVDVFDSADTAFGVSARFFANKTLAIGIGYSVADDIDAISVSARFAM
ncbi:MAG: porin family protein [Bacteroidetes bacterium]|mgnify:CR=1 FL=1|nr:MAG: porin family protein [Bacteroidota bacterium]